MSRRINKVQLIGFAILRSVGQRDALRLDGNTAFALYIHRIENLSGHFTLSQPSTDLNEAVCNSRFAVVNMGNNGKISDVTEIGQGSLLPLEKCERSLAYSRPLRYQLRALLIKAQSLKGAYSFGLFTA